LNLGCPILRVLCEGWEPSYRLEIGEEGLWPPTLAAIELRQGWATRPLSMVDRDMRHPSFVVYTLDVSTFKVPAAQRIAIWRAHSQRCVYCGEPLSFRELDIDHIIPEDLKDDECEFQRVKVDCGLPLDFDINSSANFLPVHRHCNRTKSNQILQPVRALYFLEVALGKEPAVRKHIQALALQSQKDKVLAAVAAALETGTISMDEVTELDSNCGTFPLTQCLEFLDGSIEKSIRAEEVERLLDKRILIGGTKSIDGLEYVHASGQSMIIHTCREYRIAIATGYYPSTNFAIKMTAFLDAANAIIDAASNAQVASISYVRNPRVGVADLRLLPKEVLPYIGLDWNTELKSLQAHSLAELASKGELRIISISSSKMHFEWNGAGAVLTELLRADLDGDDIEEVLVQIYTYAVGGTFGYSYVGALRRGGPDDMFSFETFGSLRSA